ncbi:MAG: type II toxin-antitoxin system VapC family toxin [Candidatus Dormibacteraceae bacterium]
MIYLDASAIVKMIRPETESDRLARWLADRHPQRVVTSKLSEVEVPRAIRRYGPDRLDAITSVLEYIDRFDIDDGVRARAAAYSDLHLRSLDAIHLATADQLVLAGKTIHAFITYDRRLAAQANSSGLTVVAPGQ